MNRSRRRSSLVLVAGLALILAACAGTEGAPTDTPVDEPTMTETPAPATTTPEPTAGETEPMDEPTEEPTEEPTDDAQEARVRLDGFAFDTDELTVAAGTEVTFLNVDIAAHTVTEGTDGQAAESPIVNEELAANQATSVTFDEPGTYEITCLFHPSMNMTVIVEG